MTKVSGNGNLDPREKQLKSLEINKDAIMFANSLFNIIERENGAVGKKLFTRILLQVRNNEIIGVLKAIKEISGHSLVYSILDETMSSDKDMREALIGEGDGQKTIRGVFTILLDKAAECGVDKDSIAEYKKAFTDELEVQLSGLTMLFDSKKLDKIVSTVIQDIENNVRVTDVERAIIEQTPRTNLQNNTMAILQERFDKAQDNFELQMLEDGIFGDIADGFSKIYGSGNTADKVRKDLETASEQLTRLASAESEEEFKAAFLDVYKVAYNPINVKAYKDAEAMYAIALEAKKSQDDYEKEFNLLLSDKPLLEEFSSVTSPTVGAGTSFRTATKEQVYEREFNKLAEVLGENGKAILENAVKDEATLEAKYNALKSYAKGFQAYMEMLTRQACGGYDFETVERRYENSYKAAFGLGNDVLKRVNDYNLSQIQGAGIAKIATVMAAMTAISIATMGTGTAGAVATAGTVIGGMTKSAVTMATLTAGTEVLDKFTSGAALKELRQNGVLSYLEKANDMTDWGQIAKASVHAGAMTLVFMGQSYALSNLTRVAGTAAGLSAQAIAYTSAGVNAAGVVATGLGIEYLMTGEISVEGATFTVLMAVMGATIQVLQINKAINASKADAQTQMQEKVQNARKVLGIDDGVELTEKLLREQMRKMALKYHSDKGGSDATMALINESYTFLKKLLKEGVNLNVATQTATATQAETVSNPNNLPVVSSTSARALNSSATNVVTTPITPAETAKHNATINAAGDRVLELDMFKKLSPSEIESLKNRETFRCDADKVVTLQFANGDKPAILLYDIDNDLTVLDKLKSSNIDVVHRSWEGYGGTIYHNTFVLNKEMVSDIISKNKELFQVRCGLSPEASVDDIYAHLVSKNTPLMSESNSDLIGLILGFPQKNTFIYALEKSADIDYQLRYHKDLTGYKQQLLEALNSPDCIYKDMPQSFRDDLSAQIKSIEKIQDSAYVINGDLGLSNSYQYVQFVDEPSETNRIRQAIQRTANAIESGELLPPVKPDNSVVGIKQQILDADSRQEFIAIRDLLKEMPPSETKTTLMQMYQQNYNEWKTQPERADVVMQYKPEGSSAVEADFQRLTSAIQDKFGFMYPQESKALCAELEYLKAEPAKIVLLNSVVDNLTNYKKLHVAIATLDGLDSTNAKYMASMRKDLGMNIKIDDLFYCDQEIKEIGQEVFGKRLQGAIDAKRACQNQNSLMDYIALEMLKAESDEQIERCKELMKLVSKFGDDDMLSYASQIRFVIDDIVTSSGSWGKSEAFLQLMKNDELLNALENHEFMFDTNGNLVRAYDVRQAVESSASLNELGLASPMTALALEIQEHSSLSMYVNALLEGPKQNNSRWALAFEDAVKHRNNVDIIASKTPAQINKVYETIDEIAARMINDPKHYLNGEDIEKMTDIEAVEYAKRVVDGFVYKNRSTLFVMADVLDKEAIDFIMRKRLDNAEDYLDTIVSLDKEGLDVLKALMNVKNAEGRSFVPAEKANFIDLIYACQNSGLGLDLIKDMIKTGRVDIAKVNRELFSKIMRNCGLTEEEIALIPDEKLCSWDLKYMHLLASDVVADNNVYVLGSYNDNSNYADLFRFANLFDSFKDAIHTQGDYAQSNARTKVALEKEGYNYDKWLNPPKVCEVNFVSKSSNEEIVMNIAQQLVADIETLRKTPAKGFIDKKFPNCIKKGEFVVPQEMLENKNLLQGFIENIIKELDSVWKRAEGNLNNPERAISAQNTLTILDHLKTRLATVSTITEKKVVKSLDWTIKMWDRVPQKDTFQGNFSGCCIAQGAANGRAMIDYQLNTAFNMIVIVDNVSGQVVGNALCYFAKDESGKPIFIIDNIEVKDSIKPHGDESIALRDSIVEYVSNMLEQVTGKNDTPIYLGSNYNDVSEEGLPKVKPKEVVVLGDIESSEAYLDALNGWNRKDPDGQYRYKLEDVVQENEIVEWYRLR